MEFGEQEKSEDFGEFVYEIDKWRIARLAESMASPKLLSDMTITLQQKHQQQ